MKVPAAHDRWQDTRVLDDSAALYRELIAAIEQARVSIDFEYYIFDADALGERFVVALADAAARGVRVRVIVDGVGSSVHGVEIAKRLFALGVEARIYHPLPWLTGAYRWSMSQAPWIFKALLLLLNINRRNHRKLCVVDAQRAWVGSQNICVSHLPLDQGGEGWRDYAVALSGAGIEALVTGFDRFWAGQHPEDLRPASRLPAPRRPAPRRGVITRYLSNRSVRARQLKNRFVTRSVGDASTRVLLVSAYFAPTARLRRALLKACRRGIDVKLLLPGESDIVVFPSLSSYYYHELIEAGARIYIYTAGVLHAKALLVDDFFILGSSNWNYRSTLHDLELDVVIREEATVRRLEQVIVGDCENATELQRAGLPPRSLRSRLWYLIRYWM